MRRWQWQQAGGRRHAYDAETTRPQVGHPLPVLCGHNVVPGETDLLGKWLEPTCWACDREVRLRENFPAAEIPPLPEPLSAPEAPSPRTPDVSPRPPHPRGPH